MSIFKKKEHNKDNPYLGLRQSALDMRPDDIGVTLDNNDQVFAAVVAVQNVFNKIRETSEM